MSVMAELPPMVFLRFLLPWFCSLTAQAAIDPVGLVIDVRQEQVQQSQLHATTRDGRRDRTAKRVRLLHVECRYLGDGYDEPATLRWYFIGKNPEGRFDYYSFGSEMVTIPRKTSLRVRIASEPLRAGKREESELLPSIPVAGRTEPAGWVVGVHQGNQRLKQLASTPGMIEWMSRNPPPAKK